MEFSKISLFELKYPTIQRVFKPLKTHKYPKTKPNTTTTIIDAPLKHHVFQRSLITCKYRYTKRNKNIYCWKNKLNQIHF